MRITHRTGDTMHRTASLALTLGILASPVLAGPDPDGYTWATITHAGNRPTNDAELPVTPGVRLGAVDYQYRMATTEVTVGQWFEFVQAYAPFYDFQGGSIADPNFTGTGINYGFDGLYVVPGRSLNSAADMSWEYAARYVNWLHNGKVNEQWAFESGVYDTATFTFNPDGTANHQATRSDGARYWIPSRDEWIKAAYYDPDRYGDGQEGYWLYPNQSDTRSVNSLMPEEGGQANATRFNDPRFPLDVGSFPDIRSYFGLLDLDGGEAEFSETVNERSIFGNATRYFMGSSWFDPWLPDDPFAFYYDRIDYQADISVNVSGGLRLAAVVPSPTGGLVFAGMFILLRRKRVYHAIK